MYSGRHSMLRERRISGSAMGVVFTVCAGVLLLGPSKYVSVFFGCLAIVFFTLAREAHLSLPRPIPGPVFTPSSAWTLESPPVGLTKLRLASIVGGVAFVGFTTFALYSPLVSAVATGGAAAVGTGLAWRARQTQLRTWSLRVQLTKLHYVELRASAHRDTIRVWDVSGETNFTDLAMGNTSFPAPKVEALLDMIGVGVLEATLQTQLMQETFDAYWSQAERRLPPAYSDPVWD